MHELSFTVHDDLPAADARVVDDGLGVANDMAAPLDEVRPLSCFARTAAGEVAAGAVGRTWGACCELQQLWVREGDRRRGIATRLVGMFEARARERGCRTFYLETWSFQAPELYRRLGYVVRSELRGFPHAITKYLMVREMRDAG